MECKKVILPETFSNKQLQLFSAFDLRDAQYHFIKMQWFLAAV